MIQDGHAKRFFLGDVTLTSGAILPQAEIVYSTYGSLNEAGDNCILMPTFYHGTHESYAPLIGVGRALDPSRYFIVIPNPFGNGVSTSPSNGLGASYPVVSIADNVRCQYRLLTEYLGVRRIQLAAGWSMGATQSLHWASAFPSMVANVLSICGTANTWPLNKVLLAALISDCEFTEGRYTTSPLRGIGAFGRVFAGWAFSATCYRDALYKQLGADTLEDFLRNWEVDHQKRDANDLLALLNTWMTADISTTFGRKDDLRTALGAIQAKCVLMPCDRDAFYTLEEVKIEASFISSVDLRTLYSPFGHCAGLPGAFPEETAIIERVLREIL